jgi:hypothetical protein
MKSCSRLIAISAILSTSFAYAQENQQESATTKEHLKVLQPFVGEWMADRLDGNGEIVLKYAWLFDNTAMSFEWGLTNPAGDYKPMYKGLIGWNAETESMVMHGVFVRGGVSKTDLQQQGKKWIYRRDTVTVDGSHVVTEQSLEFVDNDTLKYQMLKRGGETATDAPIIYKRK